MRTFLNLIVSLVFVSSFNLFAAAAAEEADQKSLSMRVGESLMVPTEQMSAWVADGDTAVEAKDVFQVVKVEDKTIYFESKTYLAYPVLQKYLRIFEIKADGSWAPVYFVNTGAWTIGVQLDAEGKSIRDADGREQYYSRFSAVFAEPLPAGNYAFVLSPTFPRTSGEQSKSLTFVLKFKI